MFDGPEGGWRPTGPVLEIRAKAKVVEDPGSAKWRESKGFDINDFHGIFSTHLQMGDICDTGKISQY